jgi:hypothetical protein
MGKEAKMVPEAYILSYPTAAGEKVSFLGGGVVI